MKKIAILTTSRADWGYLEPLVKRMATDDRFKVHVLIAGSHWSGRHGYTAKPVADSIPPSVDYICLANMSVPQKGPANQVPMCADVLTWVAQSMRIMDALVVFGDRGEMLAGAMAAAYARVPIVHLHGGENTPGGNFDDYCRHAISKFANYHCVTDQDCADNLIHNLGEEPWRVHVVGNMAWWRFDDAYQRPRHKVLRGFGMQGRNYTDDNGHNAFEGDTFAILAYHSETSRASDTAKDFAAILGALESTYVTSSRRVIAVGPNIDEGSEAIFEGIKDTPGVYFHPSIPEDDFAELLCQADFIIGNSSSGVLEAHLVGTPAINIGQRQLGRNTGRPNIINCGHSQAEVADAIRHAMSLSRYDLHQSRPANPHDTVGAIVDVLATVDKSDRTFRKK